MSSSINNNNEKGMSGDGRCQFAVTPFCATLTGHATGRTCDIAVRMWFGNALDARPKLFRTFTRPISVDNCFWSNSNLSKDHFPIIDQNSSFNYYRFFLIPPCLPCTIKTSVNKSERELYPKKQIIKLFIFNF